MASTSNPLETNEESKDVPLDQAFSALFGSSGSAAQEARSCLWILISRHQEFGGSTNFARHRRGLISVQIAVKASSEWKACIHIEKTVGHEPEQSHDASEELGDRYSSQTPDSDGGSSTPETYIDDRKKQIIDSIVFSAMQWLHSKLDVWHSHLLVGSSNPNNRGNKKRKVAETDNHETDNEDEGGNWEDRQSSRMPIQGHEDPKFACPYFKQPQYRCARCWQPFADEQGIVDHQRTDEFSGGDYMRRSD
ncbi:uncharacterized protein FSUBG_12774 [Fusarium subglutinans]|uniref:C2H2-type domain-containing protein n=1 Tax=Gibberella subglutinans TaxID=42677 RepID=A0A8H5L180_GIBSU|nr:uncharacterized protein FSUBG_12774 [Fusarium subglutinans]KAF5584460.1 hypothetical protein FSUBG_12774 [Fusarium subglutinans]